MKSYLSIKNLSWAYHLVWNLEYFSYIFDDFQNIYFFCLSFFSYFYTKYSGKIFNFKLNSIPQPRVRVKTAINCSINYFLDLIHKFVVT